MEKEYFLCYYMVISSYKKAEVKHMKDVSSKQVTSIGEVALLDKENTNEKTEIVVDTGSGSMAYNRFEMQISQTLHMAIEFYDSLDYLLVMDYYDDITLFDDEKNPEIVSYYQMKTNEESISISTAIREDWITKLYAQLERPEWIVKELGLITNCPLKVSVSVKDENGKKKTETKSYTSEKTAFEKFNPITVEKIKQDIATKKGITADEVDLSKFVHMRTILSIPKHKEIVEQEMGEFLNTRYPRITIDVVKTIFNAMMEILTKRQQYELLSDDATYCEVRQKKGISKQDFTRVIDEAMIISIPTFDEVLRVANLQNDDKYKASYEYTKIMTDSNGKSESFTSVFVKVRKLIENQKFTSGQLIWEYANGICDELYSKEPMIELIYNRMYVSVLTICIIINEMRKL